MNKIDIDFKNLVKLVSEIINSNNLNKKQSDWLYQKVVLINYFMGIDGIEKISSKRLNEIIKSKNNIDLIKNCNINYVKMAALSLNEKLLDSIEPIQIQMENIFFGKLENYFLNKEIIIENKKRQSFSLLHIRDVLVYTYWVSLIFSCIILYFKNGSFYSFVSMLTGFLIVFLIKKSVFGSIEVYNKKKIEKAVNIEKESIKNKSHYDEVISFFDKELSERNWSTNDDINKELAILKQQSIKLSLLIDKNKVNDFSYGDEWYNIKNIWLKHIPLLLDMTGDELEKVNITKVTIISMQNVMQKYINNILEEEFKELSLKQKFWAAKASGV